MIKNGETLREVKKVVFSLDSNKVVCRVRHVVLRLVEVHISWPEHLWICICVCVYIRERERERENWDCVEEETGKCLESFTIKIK